MYIVTLWIYLACRYFILAINANGRDLTVDFPQQSHWTGVIDEMEIVPSSHPGIGYYIVSLHLPSYNYLERNMTFQIVFKLNEI